MSAVTVVVRMTSLSHVCACVSELVDICDLMKVNRWMD